MKKLLASVRSRRVALVGALTACMVVIGAMPAWATPPTDREQIVDAVTPLFADLKWILLALVAVYFGVKLVRKGISMASGFFTKA
jgi:hypothetical protein